MRSEVIYGACGALFLISSAWAQDARYDSRSDRAVAGTPGAFRNLSPGEQWIARALAASEVRRDGRVPLSLNQIATLKESGMGFGQILRQMRADGDTNANNLGSVVSGSRHDLNADRHDACRGRIMTMSVCRTAMTAGTLIMTGRVASIATMIAAAIVIRRVTPIVTMFGVSTTTECDRAIATATATPTATMPAFAIMMECDGPMLTMRAARDGSLPADRIRTPHRSVLAARRPQVAEVRAHLQTPPRHRRRPAQSLA